jgi:prevent-host-death family protein
MIPRPAIRRLEGSGEDQVVTKHGKDVVVVVSAEEYQRLR